MNNNHLPCDHCDKSKACNDLNCKPFHAYTMGKTENDRLKSLNNFIKLQSMKL